MRILVLALALTAACSPVEELYLARTFTTGASLLLFEEQGPVITALAHSTPASGEVLRPAFVFDADQPARLVVAAFAPTLQAMGLSDGDRLLSRASEAPRYDSAEVYEATYADGAISSWSPVALDERLMAYVPEDPKRGCPTFDAELLYAEPDDDTGTLIALGADAAIVTSYTRILRIGSDGSVTSTPAPTRITAAGGNAEAGYYLAAVDRVLRLDPDTLATSEVATSSTFRGDLSWLSAGRSAAGASEVFVLSAKAELGHVTGGRLDHLLDIPLSGNNIDTGGVVWMGPGSVAAASPEYAQIVFWSNGVRRDENVATTALGFTVLTAIGPDRLLAVEGVSGILNQRSQAEGWKRAGLMLPPRVRVIAPFGANLAFGSKFGDLGVTDAERQCDLSDPDLASDILGVSPFGPGLLVLGVTRNRELRVYFHRPR